jgi:hypothetical protein
MGDDALNVQTNLDRIDQIIRPFTIILAPGRAAWRRAALPRDGDLAGIAPGDRPLDFKFAARIISSRIKDYSHIEIKISSPLPPYINEGATFTNLSNAPCVTIERVTIADNRARGILLQTRGPIRVRDCNILRPSGAAIELTSDVRNWWEGPGVRDVEIRNCNFVGGNDGPGRHQGTIAIFSNQRTDYANYVVHTNILISDNRFKSLHKRAIFVRSAANVIEKNNIIESDTEPVPHPTLAITSKSEGVKP